MAKLLDVRGQFTAFHAEGYPTANYSGAVRPSETTHASAVDSNVIDMGASTVSMVAWHPVENFTATKDFSIRVTIIPKWTGSPSNWQGLCVIANRSFGYYYGVWLSVTNAGKLSVYIRERSTIRLNQFSGLADTLSFTSGTRTELMIAWNGTTGALTVSQDGVALTGATGTAMSANFIPGTNDYINVGQVDGSIPGSDFYLNQLEVWDSVETTAYGALRTTFADGTVEKDITDNVDPGIGNVTSGVNYTVEGTGLTGTANIPGASDVRSGVPTGATVGTLDHAPEASVVSGVIYDGATKTGTHASPSPSDVRSGVSVGSTTGTCAVPLASQVVEGVAVDDTTGTSDHAPEFLVAAGTSYDNETKTGTLDEALESTVQQGVVYSNGSKTGTLVSEFDVGTMTLKFAGEITHGMS